MQVLRSGRVEIDAPDNDEVGFHREWLLILTKSEWDLNGSSYAAGTLLVADLEFWLGGHRDVTVLFTPDANTSLSRWDSTRNHLLLTLLQDVSSRIEVLTPSETGWTRSTLAGAPELHTVAASAVDADESDDYWVSVSGYLNPAPHRFLGDVGPCRIRETTESFDQAARATTRHIAAAAAKSAFRRERPSINSVSGAKLMVS